MLKPLSLFEYFPVWEGVKTFKSMLFSPCPSNFPRRTGGLMGRLLSGGLFYLSVSLFPSQKLAISFFWDTALPVMVIALPYPHLLNNPWITHARPLISGRKQGLLGEWFEQLVFRLDSRFAIAMAFVYPRVCRQVLLWLLTTVYIFVPQYLKFK